MRTVYPLFCIWINVQLQITFVASYVKVLRREHSLVFPNPNDIDMWNLGPHAKYVNGSLQLLDYGTYSAEYAYNGIPVNYCNWIATIDYTVTPGHWLYYGDGFVFFYTREPIKHAVSDIDINFLGGPDTFVGLGVALDTYKNWISTLLPDWWIPDFIIPHFRWPMVFPFVNNGDQTYSHKWDGFKQRLYHCPSQNVNQRRKIQVEYLNEKFTLRTYDSSGYNDCERKSATMILPPGYYFSFTALNTWYDERVTIHEFTVEEITDGEECYDREIQYPYVG